MKPTTILHLRLLSLRDTLLSKGHFGRCPYYRNFHERMEGRDHNGEFRTARAKIYPVGLNQALADAVHKFVCTTFAGVATAASLHPDFCGYRIFPVEVVQPDYHG